MKIRKKRLPIGVSDFKEIITKNYYYFDKTKFIENILDGKEGIIFELKILNSSENLSNDKIHEKLENECKIALKQIKEKEYISALKNSGVEKVLKIGIAFFGKEFEVKFEKE